jgi:hypothetical protein
VHGFGKSEGQLSHRLVVGLVNVWQFQMHPCSPSVPGNGQAEPSSRVQAKDKKAKIVSSFNESRGTEVPLMCGCLAPALVAAGLGIPWLVATGRYWLGRYWCRRLGCVFA